jgi:hypothetical protein
LTLEEGKPLTILLHEHPEDGSRTFDRDFGTNVIGPSTRKFASKEALEAGKITFGKRPKMDAFYFRRPRTILHVSL